MHPSGLTHQECAQTADARVAHPPTDKQWGLREFRIIDEDRHPIVFWDYDLRDPDNTRLRLGQSPSA